MIAILIAVEAKLYKAIAVYIATKHPDDVRVEQPTLAEMSRI